MPEKDENKKLIILVVDDDQELVSGFINLLSEEGFEVKGEYDGKSALEHVRENKVDCIIIDGLLPKMDGFKLCEEIRWSNDTKSIPIIMISGVYRAVNHASESISKYKLFDYLEKPIAPSIIIETLRKLFGDKYPKSAPLPLGLTQEKDEIDGTQKLVQYDTSNIYYMLEPDQMPLTGDLENMPFPIILYRLFTKRMTGALMITMGKAKKIIMVDNGRPVSVSSNIVSECLSQLLIKEKLLEKDLFNTIHEEATTAKCKHGEILIKHGVLTHPELAQWLRKQAEFKFYSVFNWSEGKFAFKALKNISKQSSDFTLHPFVMIKEGLRKHTKQDRLQAWFTPYVTSKVGAADHFEETMRDAAFNLKEIRWVSQRDFNEELKDVLQDHILEKEDIDPFVMSLISLGILKLRPPRMVIDPDQQDNYLGEHLDSVLTATARAHISGQAVNVKDMAKTSELSIEQIDKVEYMHNVKNMSSEEKETYTKLFNWRGDLRGKNYFEVLKLEEDSPEEDIKKQFAKLVKLCHPDTLASSSKEIRLLADEIFTMLSKAHETLSNKRSRNKYIDAQKRGGEDDATDEVAKIMAGENFFRNGVNAIKNKDFVKAKESFQEAIKLNANDGEYFIYMGWAHFNLSPNDILNRQEAIKMIDAGLELAPKFADGYFYKASIYKAMGDIQQAYEWFQKTMQTDKKHTRAKSELRLMKMRIESEKGKKTGLFSKIFKN